MIESSYFWTNVFFLSIGTIFIRGSVIALSSRIVISERVREIFSFIPAAIFPAFIAPAVFFHQGQVAWAFEKERLLVLFLAAIVCLYSRSALTTVAFGLVSLYLISYLRY